MRFELSIFRYNYYFKEYANICKYYNVLGCWVVVFLLNIQMNYFIMCSKLNQNISLLYAKIFGY